MGIDYSSSVSFGFKVNTRDINVPEECGVFEWAETIGVPFSIGANFYGSDEEEVIVFIVDNKYYNISFDDTKNYKKLDVDNEIDVDKILEVQVKLEKHNIPTDEIGWYITKLTS